MRPSRAETIDALAPWVAGLILTLPLVLTRYPPMGDLPMHEAMAALLRRYGDPVFAPKSLYATNLGHTQQLFTLLVAGLSFVVDTATAAKLVVAATIVGTLVGAARLARHVGSTPWAALATAPLVMGWTFFLGSGAGMLGIALFLATLPDLDRLAKAPTPLRAAAGIGIILVLLAAHAVTGVCAIAALGVFGAVHRPGLRRGALVAAPMLVGLAVLGIERMNEDSGTPLARAGGVRTAWHGVRTKLWAAPSYLFASHAPTTLGLVAIITATAIAILAIARLRDRSADTAGLPFWERAARHRFTLVSALLAVAFLAAPYSIGHGTNLYARFLVPTVALVIVALAPRPERTPRLAKVICSAAVFAPLLAILPEMQRADDQFFAVSRLTQQIARGSAVAIVHVGPREPGRLFDPVRAGHRALAERGGRTVFSFAEYPTSVVAVRPRARWDELTIRLHRDAAALRPESDLTRIRYVLVHIWDRDLAFVVAPAFAPEGHVVDLYGEWMLFESRLPQAPIDLPEALAPQGRGATLQERAIANADRKRPAASAAPP